MVKPGLTWRFQDSGLHIMYSYSYVQNSYRRGMTVAIASENSMEIRLGFTCSVYSEQVEFIWQGFRVSIGDKRRRARKKNLNKLSQGVTT